MASERVQRQMDCLLDEAEQALAQLNWSTLRDRVRAVLAVDPGNSAQPLTFVQAPTFRECPWGKSGIRLVPSVRVGPGSS